MKRITVLLLTAIVVLALGAQAALAAESNGNPGNSNGNPGNSNGKPGNSNGKPGKGKPGKGKWKGKGKRPGKAKPGNGVAGASSSATTTSGVTITTTAGGAAGNGNAGTPPAPKLAATVTGFGGICMINLSVSNLTPRGTYTVVFTTSAGFSNNVSVSYTANGNGSISGVVHAGARGAWGNGNAVAVLVVGATPAQTVSANSC
mgnify:CR=1 FL=1